MQLKFSETSPTITESSTTNADGTSRRKTTATAEGRRLHTDPDQLAAWRRWGPYLSERQWATVREDYSADGNAWKYFPHDQARSRAYRWGEDGLLGICDNHQRLCLSLAFWNEKDPFLKERAFGLTGPEGNHGEDLKDYYFFIDNVPTHSYMRALYKYPQAEFPYEQLRAESAKRDRTQPEYELIDTGIFAEQRYFDIFATYAKAAADDILLEITICNRSSEPAPLHVLPTVLFRNNWSWKSGSKKPSMKDVSRDGLTIIETQCTLFGQRWLYADGNARALFTENETNREIIFQTPNETPYVKDAIHRYVVNGEQGAVNPAKTGTKAALWHKLQLAGNETRVIRLRLSDHDALSDPFGKEFDAVMQQRKSEADEFYQTLNPYFINEDERQIQRQALAGMLWNKQFYLYDIRDWLSGDDLEPQPPPQRKFGRNSEWFSFNSEDVLSMPDTWEYPWFASWDLAFHTIPFAMIDPEFAKQQLMLLLREWYMHPNGQIPAYEWEFSDANPPVHAWATLRVYRIDQKLTGKGDVAFLERVFQKLLMNFTWWVNRKDANGNNVFQGGFLGLDNIGVFNRSEKLPNGGYLNQSDGTSWMGFYCLSMLSIALELARHNRSYEDIATKFFEHFLYIADAMNQHKERITGLWDEEDHFYQDVLAFDDGTQIPLKVKSLVGLIPILAVETLEPSILDELPEFGKRVRWFLKNRPDLAANVASMTTQGMAERRLLAIVDRERLASMLATMLDEAGFLSPHGIRSISRYHKDHPYILELNNTEYRVDYEPAESSSGLFGGNSNWRGPVWFPLNYLIIEALQKFHHYYDSDFLIEYPTGSGKQINLWQVARELSLRMISIFRRNKDGIRPVYGDQQTFQTDEYWRDYILFYEYFHGDNGSGLGASHQTGWTGLVAKMIQQDSEYSVYGKTPR